MKTSFVRCFSAAISTLIVASPALAARPLVPGTGTKIEYVGDNFEDTQWDFVHNFPKSSREQDERLRSPTGKSINGRWVEGPERGHPDHMQVVPTPPGGIAGSEYSLLVRTLNSGIPGYISRDTQQDDLVANSLARIGTIPVSEMPSSTIRVYLPPVDQWENRTGPQFGFRISTSTLTTTAKSSGGFFGSSRTVTENEPYWPGLWIHFRSKGSKGAKQDGAFLTYRGDERGRDIRCKEITVEQFGWWTLGLSVTPDGMVHYYASQGVDDLTAADYITSQFPYGFSAQRLRTYFIDVCNTNDGHTWSTPFVIDDPALYVVNASRVESIVQRKIDREIHMAEAKKKAQERREQQAAERQQRLEEQREQQAKRQQQQTANRSRQQQSNR
jgi:hypothetical protein